MGNVTQFPGKGSEEWEIVTDVLGSDRVKAMAVAVKYEDDTVETMWVDCSKAEIAYFIQAFQKDLHEWMEDDNEPE